jgi:hypothetical protein
MKGTCKKEKCPFFKQYGEECPFLVETWWHTDKGDKELVEDCAPVRSLLMQQDYYNRSIALQKSHEQARNEIHKTNQKLENTMERTNSFMLEAEKQMHDIRKLQRTHNKWLGQKNRKNIDPNHDVKQLDEDYEL